MEKNRVLTNKALDGDKIVRSLKNNEKTLKKDFEGIQGKLAKASKNLQFKKVEILKLKKYHKDLKASNKEFSKKCNELEKHNKLLVDKLEEANNILGELGYDDLIKLKDENCELKKALGSIEEIKDSLKKEVASLNAKLLKKESDYVKLQYKIKDFENKLSSQKSDDRLRELELKLKTKELDIKKQ